MNHETIIHTPAGAWVADEASFWAMHFLHRGDPEVVRADGEHYRLGGEDEKDPFRGYGGRYFAFRMLASGEIVRTTNLWHQGQIPQEWRRRLPDNAVRQPQCEHDFPDPPKLSYVVTTLRFGRHRCALEAGHDWSPEHVAFVRPGMWLR